MGLINWKNFAKAIVFCISMFLLIYFSYVPFIFFIGVLLCVICGICLVLFFLNMIFDFWRW